MLPTPYVVDEQLLRLYCGAVGSEMVSRVVAFDVDRDHPTRTVSALPQCLLDIGAPGHFDDNGVVPCAVVSHDAGLRLYYAGFQKQTKIPYTILTGAARSEDGGNTFTRELSTPFLERSAAEPFFRVAPSVLATGSSWRMWYIGGGEWVQGDGRLLPVYSLRTMLSSDGDAWPATGDVCIAPAGDEIGYGRPWVESTSRGYRMWYSVRRRTGYRIGYAESGDGLSWNRLDTLLDLGPALAGFDDEMTCHPAIVRRSDETLMFYNGNGYGRSGIGVAILEQD